MSTLHTPSETSRLPTMSEVQARRKTTFVTFYSFKGGVGRTMLLLNAACILADRGQQVLMIDFDLEAPGLTEFRFETCDQALAPRRPGLLELIADYLDELEADSSEPLIISNMAEIAARYITPSTVPRRPPQVEGGRLDLMPAGIMDETYIRRMRDVDLDWLYDEGVGKPLFEMLKTTISTSGRYDFVLVDARTGFSDESGICTRELADHLVVVTGLNRQNVEGTAAFLRLLKANRWKEGQADTLTCVVSPVPAGEDELKAERLAAAAKSFSDAGYPSDLAIQIPYHPRLSIDEHPFAVNSGDPSPLARAYQRVHDRLREIAQDTPARRIARCNDCWDRGRYGDALRMLRELALEDWKSVDLAMDSMVDRLPMTESAGSIIDEFFALWLSLPNAETRKLVRNARVLLNRGELQRAETLLEQALMGPANHGDVEGRANAFYYLGVALSYRGEFDRAQWALHQARTLFEGAGNMQSLVDVVHCVGSVRYLQGRLDEARLDYEWCRMASEQTNDELNLAAALSQEAKIAAMRGDEPECVRLLDRTDELLARLDVKMVLAEAYVDRAECLVVLGKHDAALSYLNAHWSAVDHNAHRYVRMMARVVRAQASLALGDVAGACDDAETADGYFRSQDVHTKWSEAAGRLLASTSAGRRRA